jgi:hypothetical protein
MSDDCSPLVPMERGTFEGVKFVEKRNMNEYSSGRKPLEAPSTVMAGAMYQLPQGADPRTSVAGLRYDEGKNQIELLPPEWIWGLGEVMTQGARKYAKRNWEKGMKWSRVVGSLFRHVLKFLAGERYDPETGCHHMLHAAWNCLALVSYDLRGLGENDLPQANVLARLRKLDTEGGEGV